jgi:hypothetical protein
MKKRRKWDKQQLEALMLLVNLEFPDQKINSIERLKTIIRQLEKIK